jgi:Tfp pilus assembly protein PilZ
MELSMCPEDGDDRYNQIPRLFRRIALMSEEQQAELLRHLLRGRIQNTLFKIVVEMSDSQQAHLLNQIENEAFSLSEIQTVSIDEDAAMRGHRRKRCLLAVTYTSGTDTYQDYILDISSVGVFIETERVFSVGQEMILSFKLPNYQQPLKLDAAVAWIGQKGIGVRFRQLSSYQEEIIRSFIEKEENR